MRESLIAYLQCPSCRDGELAAVERFPTREGELVCLGCSSRFAVRDGIPLLVPKSSPLHASVEALLREQPFSVKMNGSGRTGAERQRDYWESDLGHREADHPIVEGFSRQRWEHIGRLLPLDQVKSALDVGAGNGFSTCYAPRGIECVATDGSVHMLRRHPDQDLALADAQSLTPGIRYTSPEPHTIHAASPGPPANIYAFDSPDGSNLSIKGFNDTDSRLLWRRATCYYTLIPLSLMRPCSIPALPFPHSTPRMTRRLGNWSWGETCGPSSRVWGRCRSISPDSHIRKDRPGCPVMVRW